MMMMTMIAAVFIVGKHPGWRKLNVSLGPGVVAMRSQWPTTVICVFMNHPPPTPLSPRASQRTGHVGRSIPWFSEVGDVDFGSRGSVFSVFGVIATPCPG